MSCYIVTYSLSLLSMFVMQLLSKLVNYSFTRDIPLAGVQYIPLGLHRELRLYHIDLFNLFIWLSHV